MGGAVGCLCVGMGGWGLVMELRQRQPSFVMPAIRKAAKGEACTIRHPDHCNGNRETTVLAHANWGKPVGGKTSDFLGAFACSGCHKWMDQTRDPERMRMWIRAHAETLYRLFERGILKVS